LFLAPLSLSPPPPTPPPPHFYFAASHFFIAAIHSFCPLFLLDLGPPRFPHSPYLNAERIDTHSEVR
jgi:hypothetical protein